MYCDKLMKIIQVDQSSVYEIDKILIKKLDFFIKKKTTLREREKLNPLRFSIEMAIKQKTALMVYILGTEVGLFKSRMYYKCTCGEHFEIKNPKEVECCPTCYIEVAPNIDRSRIFLYFKLCEIPSNCDWNREELLYPLDFLEANQKENFTVADLDRFTEKGRYDSVIGLKDYREEIMDNYLAGEE